jgi:orotidine-5'-phosphate decarboxylase
MATNFADRLIEAIHLKGNPCVVGLDPRLDLMPQFVLDAAAAGSGLERARRAIVDFHTRVIDVVAPHVPAVKLQVAFYEQYGVPGMQALVDTIAAARAAGLVVIADAKRNDIASTAQAYANAFLGRADVAGEPTPAFEVDCVTVSPFLGRDSLDPFVSTCAEYGKGIFVLVKTSNAGSIDVQDRVSASDDQSVSAHLARVVDQLGAELVGESGYSSIGAVVGATFPNEARELRALMPRAIILVPGYGAQGGTATDAMAAFNDDGLGAVVNASRSITYSFGDRSISEAAFAAEVERAVTTMTSDVAQALSARRRQPV